MGLRPTYDAIDAFAPDRLSTDADAASASHLGFLDGVRGCAALYVVAHHAMLNLPPVASRIDALMRRAFALGHFSVDVFIVLSGFCLMLPVLRRPGNVGLWPFIGRRAVRILPTYYVALLCSLLLIGTVIGQPSGTHWDVSLPVTRRDVALHMMLMHDWSASSALRINHPFWSIAVEWKIGGARCITSGCSRSACSPPSWRPPRVAARGRCRPRASRSSPLRRWSSARWRSSSLPHAGRSCRCSWPAPRWARGPARCS
ncbi:MAG: acyltransferase [Deltaproteobacteria bacterium]|nr:MAG: acyltransferase [Deltaproteobacteria bacterium]